MNPISALPRLCNPLQILRYTPRTRCVCLRNVSLLDHTVYFWKEGTLLATLHHLQYVCMYWINMYWLFSFKKQLAVARLPAPLVNFLCLVLMQIYQQKSQFLFCIWKCLAIRALIKYWVNVAVTFLIGPNKVDYIFHWIGGYLKDIIYWVQLECKNCKFICIQSKKVIIKIL